MFSHVTLGIAEWPRARPFWIALMEVRGAYVRDPDGNKLQAVCHSAGG